MKVRIQNMVSLRCKIRVESVLDGLGIAYTSVELGEVYFVRPITPALKLKLKEELHKSGLEVIYDKKALLIEKIIKVVIEMVNYSDELPQVNFSKFLSEKMQLDYHKMALLFSKMNGVTLEHFIILHKVERIKELLVYNELNLTEISYKMNYCGVAHLSKQFKQVTGLTPTFYKSLTTLERENLNHE